MTALLNMFTAFLLVPISPVITVFFYQLRLYNKRIGSLVPRVVAVCNNRPSTKHGIDRPLQMIEIFSKDLLRIA